jgi:DNA repair protein RadD
MAYSLRWYQSEAVSRLFAYLNEKLGAPIICAATGSGKSLIIAAIILEAIKIFSETRIIVLSHVKEILQQDAEKLISIMPHAPAGIYSASLKKRQFIHPIIFGGIHSVYDKAHLFGKRHLLIIDECHMVQGKNLGMYGRFISDLKAINPNMRIIGLTATDYRASTGLLTDGEGKIFDDVVYEITIPTLIDEGYLTPPVGKHLVTQADMTGVKMLGDDFNQKQMAERFSKLEFIEAVIKEDLPYFEGRKTIALFCPTIEIANHVAQCMNSHGIPCEAMHGDMTDEDISNKDDIRADKLRRFKSGELRALASVGMLTVGTDIPNMDCLVLLFATQSPGLLAQVIGRGFRVVYANGHPQDTKEQRRAAIAAGPKPNFLCLDHGGNLERHGGVADIQKPQQKKKGQRKALPKAKHKVCEICRTSNTLEALTCIICGSTLKIERDPTTNLSLEASNADIMGTPFSRGEIAQWFDVEDVKYSRHVKQKSEMLRITYHSGILQFDEYKMMSWLGEWWAARSSPPKPKTVHDALKLCDTLKKPKRVQVRKKDKFYEILRYEFDEAVQSGSIGSVAGASA